MKAIPAVQLFCGRVMHARHRPVRHRFLYPVFFIGVDIDHLPPSRWWLGMDGPGLIAFRSRDHGDGSGRLRPWLEKLLSEQGVPLPRGRVELQCFPRVLGYQFKPVSFWYCHDADGTLRLVLAEVNNTFGERHVYLLQAPDGAAIDRQSELRATKVFHVSPFCEIAGHYRFRFLLQAERRVVHIDHYDREGLLLSTFVQGKARPATMVQLLRTFLVYPWQSLTIIARIHWQALLLFKKRVPWHRRADATTEESLS